MGGKIKLNSKVGAGSVFYFSLPLNYELANDEETYSSDSQYSPLKLQSHLNSQHFLQHHDSNSSLMGADE